MILADPLTTDVHCMTPEERNYHAIKQLPISFAHAITLFAQSDYAKQIMGNSLHELFLNHKKEEFIRYNSFVTNWELHTYFES